MSFFQTLPHRTALLLFSLPLLCTATSPLSDLLNGFLSGLQADPLHPSSCVQAFTGITSNWNGVLSTANFAWTSGQLANFFLVLYQFDSFLGLFTTTLAKCSISQFAAKLSALGTVTGVFQAMYVLGTNMNEMAVTVT